jgi:hypothetical protein
LKAFADSALDSAAIGNGVIVIIIIIIIIIRAPGTMSIIRTVPERFTWKALHRGTTENSLAGYFILGKVLM